jgi:hypothetical protein
MPVVAIERLVADGPFDVGDTCEFTDDHPTALEPSREHFTGIIVEVAPIDDWRVRIKLELSDDEHERLLASRR